MRTIATLSATIGMLLFTGCSTTWQYVKLPDQGKKIEDASKARIYVIRSPEPAGRVHVDVIDGKQLMGSTAPGGYLCWERKPGEVVVTSSSWGNSRVALNAAPGEVYYLLQRVDPGRVYVKTSLEIVSPEIARPILAADTAPTLRRLAPPFGRVEVPVEIVGSAPVGVRVLSGGGPGPSTSPPGGVSITVIGYH